MASMQIELPRYVNKRWTDNNETLRYRRVVPADCQKAIGRKVWTRTWKQGTSLERICSEAATMAFEHDQKVKEARGEIVSPAVVTDAETLGRKLLAGDPSQLYDLMNFLHENTYDGKLGVAEIALENVVRNQGTYQAATIKLSEAMDLDQKNNADLRAEKPVRDATNDFIKLAGDIDVTAITHGMVTDWKVARLEKQAIGTVKSRMSRLAAMINRTYKYQGIKRDNPFTDHRFPKVDKRAARLPLNKTMFAMVDKYLATSNSLDRQTRNMLGLARNTLTGAKELAGLVVSNLKLDDDIPHMILRENDVRDLKNAHRERKTPLVGIALEAAKDALSAALARGDATGSDDTPIFLGYSEERGADTMSQKMTKAIRDAGVPKSPRLTGYSLRHSMKQALRKSRCPDHVQHDLMGHASRGVSDDYGTDANMEEKRDALLAALPHLGDVDLDKYCEAERV